MQHYYNPNKKYVCTSQVYWWVWVLNIFKKYEFVLVKIVLSLRTKLKIRVTNLTTEGMVKLKVIFLKLIIMLWCHIVAIFIKRKHILPWKQCVPFHLIIMLWHTGPFCCAAVKNFHVFSYLVGNWTDMTQICVQPYVFIFTYSYHAILCMADVQTRKKTILSLCYIVPITDKKKFIHTK